MPSGRIACDISHPEGFWIHSFISPASTYFTDNIWIFPGRIEGNSVHNSSYFRNIRQLARLVSVQTLTLRKVIVTWKQVFLASDVGIQYLRNFMCTVRLIEIRSTNKAID